MFIIKVLSYVCVLYNLFPLKGCIFEYVYFFNVIQIATVVASCFRGSSNNLILLLDTCTMHLEDDPVKATGK